MMTKNEFFDNWSEDILKSLQVIVGKKSNIPYSINCYEEKGIWIISEIGERQDVSIIMEGEESTVFTKLNKIVRGEVKLRERRNQ
ncbi:MAG: hypothetical protein IJC02_08570 [Lachnospiraceae bacterium]|nr:hypothetical protein [Lachnospiraceae bacterium]MBQ3513559.1 hypothetical protein [Lachnospiraceae bacterium]MBQ6996435.1 hypothetical protein [Lachnospiraceae bacterium]